MSIGNVNLGVNEKSYDKNEIKDVMMKNTSDVSEREDEDGRHVDIFDTETNTLYSLVDIDKDGTFDSLRKEVRNSENQTSSIFDDVDFDGTFDRKIDGKNMGNGHFTCAIDYDYDGNVDEYKYMTDDIKI